MFFPSQIFTLWQKRPNILEETVHEICDAQEMMHYGLLLGRKNTRTHGSIHMLAEINQQKSKNLCGEGSFVEIT